MPKNIELLTALEVTRASERGIYRDGGGLCLYVAGPTSRSWVYRYTLNGAVTIGFLIDSGARDVSVPADVVLTLVRSGTVTKSDILSDQTYTLADGSQVKAARFRLRTITVGNVTIHNVIASTESEKAEPLLGQSFLSRLPGWAIDNQRQVLVIGK